MLREGLIDTWADLEKYIKGKLEEVVIISCNLSNDGHTNCVITKKIREGEKDLVFVDFRETMGLSSCKISFDKTLSTIGVESPEITFIHKWSY